MALLECAPASHSDPSTTDGRWPELASVPSPLPGVPTVMLDGSLALYDEVGHMLILLNSSASAVWERCDGESTFAQIVEDLAGRHSAPSAVVHADAHGTLHKLARLGLVSDARVLL